MALTAERIDEVIRTALDEDIGRGDVTTDSIVPVDTRCRAVLLLEEPGIACGVRIARAVFQSLEPTIRVDALVKDGARIEQAPAAIAEINGPARAILTGERTALNLVARLCGIASLTRQYVDCVEGTSAVIRDTRKTTPGLRRLEKYAVRCGGGQNHRFGLDDAILVKENHLRLGGGITAVIAALPRNGNELQVQVEAETLGQVCEALDAGVGQILLDNMSPEAVAEAVKLVAGRARLEASGGITLATVRAYAETGVDFISVGALTHAARSLHVSLEVQ